MYYCTEQLKWMHTDTGRIPWTMLLIKITLILEFVCFVYSNYVTISNNPSITLNCEKRTINTYGGVRHYMHTPMALLSLLFLKNK